MSIATDRDERDQAKTRIADEPSTQLRQDLAYWSIAKVDHHARFGALTEERFAVGELYREADAWVDLIAEELHRRRPGGGAPIE